jgi:hypothetical protein
MTYGTMTRPPKLLANLQPPTSNIQPTLLSLLFFTATSTTTVAAHLLTLVQKEKDKRAKQIAALIFFRNCTKMAPNKEEEKTRQIETLVQLTGLSRPDFGVLTKLNLPNCGLSSLPSCLPDILPNLSVLFMPKNKFEELPSVIGSCPNLQVR